MVASLTLDDIHRNNFSPDALYALPVGKPLKAIDHTDARPMLIFSQHGYSKVRSRLFFDWHSLLCPRSRFRDCSAKDMLEGGPCEC